MTTAIEQRQTREMWGTPVRPGSTSTLWLYTAGVNVGHGLLPTNAVVFTCEPVLSLQQIGERVLLAIS